MNKILLSLLLLCCAGSVSAQQTLPLYNKQSIVQQNDWLLGGDQAKAGLYQTPEGYLVLSNGLVSRTFTTTPNAATVALEVLGQDISFLRSVRPEAEIVIDGFTFEVGGCNNAPHAIH